MKISILTSFLLAIAVIAGAATKGTNVPMENAHANAGTDYSVNTKRGKHKSKTYTIEGKEFINSYYWNDENARNFKFRNADETWEISFSLKSKDGRIAGVHTIDDVADYDCSAYNCKTGIRYLFTEMNVTIAIPDGAQDEDQGCEITGTAKDECGDTFNFHMKKNAPIKPKEVKNIEVEVETAEWPCYYIGDVGGHGGYYEVKEKQNPANKWVLFLTKTKGESTLPRYRYGKGIEPTNTCRRNILTEDSLHVNNGKITQTFDASKFEIAVDAALVMNDSIQYNFSFTAPASKEDEKTITFNNLLVEEYVDGLIKLNASNDSTEVEIRTEEKIPSEAYTDENCTIELGYGNPRSCGIIYAKSELAADGTTVFKTKFLGTDKILYTIEANCVIPAVEDTLRMNFSDCKLEDHTFEESYIGNYRFRFSKGHSRVELNSKDPVGHYTTNDISNDSFIDNVGGYCIYNADFTVTKSDTTYVLSGKFQVGHHLVYLTMECPIGLRYDNYTDNVDVAYTTADIKRVYVEQESGMLISYLEVTLTDKDRSDKLVLYLNDDNEIDHPYTLPAKEYNITEILGACIMAYIYGLAGDVSETEAAEIDESLDSDSYTAIIKLMQDRNILLPSYSKTNDQGKVQTPLWYLVGGTATINKDGSMEINAVNSYGKTIHATASKLTPITDTYRKYGE